MEGLVNYSSEDEHDEKSSRYGAERANNSRRSRGSSSSYNKDASFSKSTYAGRSTDRRDSGEVASSSHRESDSSKSKLSSNNQRRREEGHEDHHPSSSRDKRLDYKESRDSHRDYNNGNRDYKNDRDRDRNRYKDHNNSYRRNTDNYRDEKRAPRDDDRDRRTNRHSGSSSGQYSHNKERFGNNARYNDSSNRYQRSRDHNDRYNQHHQHNQRRERSSDRHTHRSRSHSRSKSRSPPHRSAYDQARITAQQMETKLSPDKSEINDKSSTETRKLPQARNFEALLSLPLADTVPKQPNIIAISPAVGKGTTEPAVIQLPSYYNPSVINPTKYAEQVQKRKLIWGAKKAEETSGKWAAAQFSEDSDGKVASKFMRLMGVKGAASGSSTDKPETDVKSREAMFTSMEKQYEVARQVTHTMRGVGLGFSSQSRPV